MSRAPADLVYSHAWVSQCPECHGVLGIAYFDPQDLASVKAAAEFVEGWDHVVWHVRVGRPLPGRPGHQATCSYKRERERQSEPC